MQPATSFEITVWVQDDQYAGAVGLLVASVAEEAGYAASQCTAFAERVDAAVRASLPGLAAPQLLPVTVRRHDGPVEVVIAGNTLTLEV